MTIAYLRVSTGRQQIENQKIEINKYAAARGISIDRWYHDVVSGKTDRKNRQFGIMMDKMAAGDVLIVTEVSRLSRNLLDIMNLLYECLQRKIVLHCIKEGYVFEDNMNSKILGFAFGLVAEIERNLISARTKEALYAKREQGVKLGRPVGSAPKTSLLLENMAEVSKLVGAKVPYRTIALKYNVSICTLNRFVRDYVNKTG